MRIPHFRYYCTIKPKFLQFYYQFNCKSIYKFLFLVKIGLIGKTAYPVVCCLLTDFGVRRLAVAFTRLTLRFTYNVFRANYAL